MLTALSVARDCNIVAPGQRVILVHSTQIAPNRPPALYYTNSSSSLPTAVSIRCKKKKRIKFKIDFKMFQMSCNGDVSQTTNSTSVVSLDTLETGSAITDLEFSPTTETRYINFS